MDTMIYDGSTVKKIGKNMIAGHLVLFSTAQDPDLECDYFDAKTDFDFEDGDKRSLYFNHGVDSKVGNTKIGTATLTKTDIGVWMEAIMHESDEYAKAILKMVDDGRMGYSSGAVSHLVRRTSITKRINHVDAWPIGEASVTHTPAEPRTVAVALKTWSETLKASTLGEHTEHNMASAALMSLNDRLMSHVQSTLHDWHDDKKTENEKADLVCNGLDEHCQIGKKMVRAMVQGDYTTAKSILDEGFKGEFKRLDITSVRELEQVLRDAGISRKNATAWALHGYNSLRDAGEPEPITPAEPPPLIDEAAMQAREFKLLRLALQTDGLRRFS